MVPRFLLLTVVLLGTGDAWAAALVHHDMQVRLDPAQGELAVVDTLDLGGLLAADPTALSFNLHAGLQPP